MFPYPAHDNLVATDEHPAPVGRYSPTKHCSPRSWYVKPHKRQTSLALRTIRPQPKGIEGPCSVAQRWCTPPRTDKALLHTTSPPSFPTRAMRAGRRSGQAYRQTRATYLGSPLPRFRERGAVESLKYFVPLDSPPPAPDVGALPSSDSVYGFAGGDAGVPPSCSVSNGFAMLLPLPAALLGWHLPTVPWHRYLLSATACPCASSPHHPRWGFRSCRVAQRRGRQSNRSRRL